MARRISKLEVRFAARRNEPGHTLADVLQRMRERRRCRLVAEGSEPEEYPPFIDAGDRSWTLSERMRCRFEPRRISMEQSV
jgi:hypothetical protein